MAPAEPLQFNYRRMAPDAKVYVAGHRGLVGSAVMRRLARGGYERIVTRTRDQLDLTRQEQVEAFLAEERPEVVICAAAKVGGILANDIQRAQFIRENLAIQLNLIHGAYEQGVQRLLFLGTSCIYPRQCPQPIKEEYLLTGKLESTNEPYAIAKIAGIKMCEAYNTTYGTKYLSVMPTNLYGPNDNFDLETSHVLPALLHKFHRAKVEGAKQVTLWGSGKPKREFLHVDDLADACVYLLEKTDETALTNVGTGKDIPVLELAELIRDVVGCEAEIVHDTSKPDGTPRKLLDVGRLASLGWEAKIGLREGIEQTYRWFVDQAK